MRLTVGFFSQLPKRPQAASTKSGMKLEISLGYEETGVTKMGVYTVDELILAPVCKVGATLIMTSRMFAPFAPMPGILSSRLLEGEKGEVVHGERYRVKDSHGTEVLVPHP